MDLGPQSGALRLRTRVPLTVVVFVAIAVLADATHGVAAPVPFTLFFVWPVMAAAYWLGARVAGAALLFLAGLLVPVLLVGGDPVSRVLFMGSLTIVTGMAGLVVLMRRDQGDLEARLLAASGTDELTGLMNRRSFTPAFEARLADAALHGRDVSVALIDLDHFKQFNDAHGHLAGDDALRLVASILRDQSRDSDLICRFGGEEFAIVLEGAAPTEALAFLRRLAIELRRAPTTVGTRLTVSAGIAVLTHGSGASSGDLLDRADAALYAAKGAGRNRSACWTSGGAEIHDPVGDEVPGDGSRGGLRALTTRRGRRTTSRPIVHSPGSTVGGTDSGPPARARADRDLLLSRTATVLFIGGGGNLLSGCWLLPLSATSTHWQWFFSAVMVVTGVLCSRLPGSRRMAQAVSIWACLLIAGVVATIDPLVTPPLFLAWPVVIGAYFCSPRFVSWLTLWATATLLAGLELSEAAISKSTTVVETVVNIAALGALFTMMRQRERRLVERLERAANVDPLTGLPNRRALSTALPLLTENAVTYDTPLAFLMIDADQFKRFNDTHGHLAGDAALVRIAAALRAAAPPRALLCRFGGEEFAAALPNASVADAEAFARQLAGELRRSGDETTPPVTISAGIATFGGADDRTEPLMARADRALYAAKAAGRDRFVTLVAGDPEPGDLGVAHAGQTI